MKFRLNEMMNIKSGEIPEMKAIIEKIKIRNRPLTPINNAFIDEINIIAELKHSSPSAGNLSGETDYKSLIIRYLKGGASAVSVLTEKIYFNGSYDHLHSVASLCSKPVLCKDFIYFEEQIEAAYLCGADMVLLIAKIIEQKSLKNLYNKIKYFGMTPLVEIHEENEIENIMPLNPEFILVNMRNLETLEINIRTGINTLKKIPAGVTTISASGINSRNDISYIMDECGVNNFLIGSSLMRSIDPEEMIRKFKNVC